MHHLEAGHEVVQRAGDALAQPLVCGVCGQALEADGEVRGGGLLEDRLRSDRLQLGADAEDMGRYGEIWGDMGRYGEVWGDMAA